MPSCFQLVRKGETEPCSLVKVDEELCSLLGKQPHSLYYVAGWFDCIGVLIATKSERSLGSNALRNDVLKYYPENEELHKILAYLEENYTSRSFYSPR